MFIDRNPIVLRESQELIIKMKCPIHGDIEIKVKPPHAGEVVTGIACPFPHPTGIEVLKWIVPEKPGSRPLHQGP